MEVRGPELGSLVTNKNWCTSWLSGQLFISAQVMISWFMRSSPMLGSALTMQSLLGTLSLPGLLPPDQGFLSLILCLSPGVSPHTPHGLGKEGGTGRVFRDGLIRTPVSGDIDIFPRTPSWLAGSGLRAGRGSCIFPFSLLGFRPSFHLLLYIQAPPFPFIVFSLRSHGGKMTTRGPEGSF